MPSVVNKLIVLTRTEQHDKYTRDHVLRLVNAGVDEATIDYRPKSQIDIEGWAITDALLPHYANAILIAQNTSDASKTGDDLDELLDALGEPRLDEVGAEGFVVANTGSSGATIVSGDVLLRVSDGAKFQCLATKLYQNGDPIPVGGIDTGPSTNTVAGAGMRWRFPRPGSFEDVVVLGQSNGDGLIGGRDRESDDDAHERLRDLRANPPAGGNDAQYQALARKTPGIAIQQVFTYPSILGPGTMGLVFLLLPSGAGKNRLPTATHIASVLAWLTRQMPGDDVILVGAVIAAPIDVALRIGWAPDAIGWTDVAPWPIYSSPKVTVGGFGLTSTTFRLGGIDGSAVIAPPVGNTIAFYDAAAQVFRRKKILTSVFHAGTQWDVTCDTTNGASDTGYTPYIGQPCCPWSDGLDALAPPVVGYFDSLGPSEQKDAFWDPGLRERRSPRSPQRWPNEISSRLLAPIFDLASVENLSLQEPIVPFVSASGIPGISSNLITLRTLLAFPI